MNSHSVGILNEFSILNGSNEFPMVVVWDNGVLAQKLYN